MQTATIAEDEVKLKLVVLIEENLFAAHIAMN